MPKRIQRRRTKGWRMPEGAVFIGRPTMWGNPISVEVAGSRERAVELYRKYLQTFPTVAEEASRFLRGKDLACWCNPFAVCHGDVLLEVANGEP